MRRPDTALTGATLGIALLEAASAHARPAPTQGMRVNAHNTSAPSGDMYQTGRGLLAAGDVTGAMVAFRQALLEAPQSIDALNGLGVCYDRLGRFDVGRGYYDTALAIDPGSTLVLNNLGYSLYLQGDYPAAIPVLQRAAEATDPAVVAASQRVLAMIAEQLREAAATSSSRVARAEAISSRAHIELAANGEQRLVFGTTNTDDALVAALGEDAALVTIATPARHNGGELQSIAGSAAQQDLAGSTSAGRGSLPSIVYLSGGATGATRSATLTLGGPVDDARQAPSAEITASPIKAAATVTLLASAVQLPAAVAAATSREQALPRPMAPARDDRNSPVVLAGNGSGGSRRDQAIPAWLLSSRRTDLPTGGRAGTGQDPRRNDAVAAFESDLVDLNRFAARMRGVAAAPAIDAVGDRDAAVARLEALITRIRSA